MKVLWFEITQPKRYTGSNNVLGSWQDALEDAIVKKNDIELIVAFESESSSEVKIIDGVTYVPLQIRYSFFDKIKSMISVKTWQKKILKVATSVIQTYKPDLVHVFGCETPFGLLSESVDVPFVIHIQGSLVLYENAYYPPKYNMLNYVKAYKLNFVRILHYFFVELKNRSHAKMEKQIWGLVSSYMGRTDWDYAISYVLHPNRIYYHVEEMLRPAFLSSNVLWQGKKNKRVKLFTIGCTTYWKGPDMFLKTARILKEYGFEFEWSVAGHFPSALKLVVENTEHSTFEENGVKFLGVLQPNQLIEELSSSTIYVHTSYMENSPNSICEAQCLGVPVVSTNVGGISTLLDDGKLGILVPANDPWQMAYSIISLSSDDKRMEEYSKSSREFALKRHDSQNVYNQLMECYNSIIKSY